MISRRQIMKGAAALPLVGAGAVAIRGGGTRAYAQDGTPVIVGSKDFAEQFILGEIYLQTLEDMGIPFEDSINLGGTQIAAQALQSGEISIYPEYTGTALSEIIQITFEEFMEQEDIDEDEDLDQALFDFVSEYYMDEWDLVWLERSPANNTQTLAVSQEFIDETGIETLTDLAEYDGEVTASVISDFPEREDGLLGLQAIYGGNWEDGNIELLPVAAGLRYQAFLDGEADIVQAFGTDGQIAGYDLVLLEDDQGLWPPYNPAPIIEQAILDEYPEIEERFNEIAPLLTDEQLSEMNWAVEGDENAEPADVAAEFLEENDLLNG